MQVIDLRFVKRNSTKIVGIPFTHDEHEIEIYENILQIRTGILYKNDEPQWKKWKDVRTEDEQTKTT